MLVYTLPTFADGLSISFIRTNWISSRLCYFIRSDLFWYWRFTVSYGVGDGNSTANDTDATSMKASYAYGPVTVAYSNHEFDTNAANGDQEMDSYKLSYTVSDELSISYGAETIEETGHTEDTEIKNLYLLHCRWYDINSFFSWYWKLCWWNRYYTRQRNLGFRCIICILI